MQAYGGASLLKHHTGQIAGVVLRFYKSTACRYTFISEFQMLAYYKQCCFEVGKLSSIYPVNTNRGEWILNSADLEFR